MTKKEMFDAVDLFFSDLGRPCDETKDGLEELRDDIEAKIESLTEASP